MKSKKIALIAGITGQDGFIFQSFNQKNYYVIGLSKRIALRKKN